MKLFTKTFLFFSSVIVFASVMTAFFITNSVRSTNAEDARRELLSAAQVTNDNFNAWKRGIWKSLIQLKNEAPGEMISADEAADPLRVERYLRETFVRSGYDVVYYQLNPERRNGVIPVSYNTFSLAELQTLDVKRPHPYVEIRRIGTTLAITGAIRLSAGKSATDSVDIYIIKRIDAEFCESLTVNSDASCSFFTAGRFISGWASAGLSGRTLETLVPQNAHTEAYAVPIGDARYNVAVQRVPSFEDEQPSQMLTMQTYLPNQPYERRIDNIGRIVLYVTIATAVLTLLISLVLTSNISVPVRRLLSSMHRFQRGDFVQTPGRQTAGEIGELLSGFNDMAAHLHRDRVAMDQFIQEITFLNRYNETIIESIRAGILIIDERYCVRKTNRAFLELFTLEAAGVDCRSIDDLDLPIIDKQMRRQIISIVEGTGGSDTAVKRTRNGRVFDLKLYPLAVQTEGHQTGNGCVLIADDISAKVEFEQKIFQAEKLASLSVLSAGVAHEINNPLGSIMTNVQNLIMEETDVERQTALKFIERETRRIASIVQKLLRFSAPDAEPGAGCDVDEAVTEALMLVGYGLGSDGQVGIECSLAGDLPDAAIGANELKQIIINLVRNGVQAIPGSGTVRVETRLRGKQVCITVTDTGSGIPAKVRPHIFDPFYTTKRNGEGTGLGLSMVYGILSKHNGTIRVSSRSGRGTRMTLMVPAAAPSEPILVSPSPSRGGRTVRVRT